MKKVQVNIVTWKEGKYYVALCLNTNVSSFGESKKEATENTEEALDLYFEDEEHPYYIQIADASIMQSQKTYA